MTQGTWNEEEQLCSCQRRIPFRSFGIRIRRFFCSRLSVTIRILMYHLVFQAESWPFSLQYNTSEARVNTYFYARHTRPTSPTN